MKKKLTILLAVFVVISFLISSLALAGKSKYSMKDLQSLLSSKSYLELLEHGTDIKPSARTSEWEQLISEAALGQMTSLSVSEDPRFALSFSEGLLLKYPHLSGKKEFLEKRATVGHEAFRLCLENQRWAVECERTFQRFVRSDPENHELALEAAKLVRRKMAHYVALPYFEMALARGGVPADCKDKDLHTAVLAGLNLPKKEKESVVAKRIAFNHCWKELSPAVVKEARQGNKYFLENACSNLLNKKALKGLLAKKCTRLAKLN